MNTATEVQWTFGDVILNMHRNIIVRYFNGRKYITYKAIRHFHLPAYGFRPAYNTVEVSQLTEMRYSVTGHQAFKFISYRLSPNVATPIFPDIKAHLIMTEENSTQTPPF